MTITKKKAYLTHVRDYVPISTNTLTIEEAHEEYKEYEATIKEGENTN